MQQLTITATMQDGTAIVETAADFGAFVDLVLSFRRDSDVARLTWRLEDAPAAQRSATAAGQW